MGSIVAAMALVAGLATLLAITTADGWVTNSAEQRARHGLDVLATLGPYLPKLTPATLQRGLSTTAVAELNAAVSRGRNRDVLDGLRITGRGGSTVYSSYEYSSGPAGRTLDVNEPILDANGRTYAALEVSLPLARSFPRPARHNETS